MSDAAPLLPYHNASDKSSKTPAVSVDDALEDYLGRNGFCQLLQAVLISFAWYFDAQQTFINVFTDVEPAWHCAGGGDGLSCRSEAASDIPCDLPQGSWDWDLPKQASVVSEWDLQCSGPVIVGLPASAYFVGCFVGGFLLPILGDSFLGRRKVLYLSCLALSLTGGLAMISTGVWTYSALRFLCGCARATVGTSALVLSTEIVGKRIRGTVSVVGFIFFTLGFLSLPAFAYMNGGSSWRALYLWTSAPCFLYTILIFFSIGESPRWLLLQGRRDEAIEALKRITDAGPMDLSFSNLMITEETSNLDVFSSVKMLLKTKWAAWRLITLSVIGAGIGMVYYGMPLNVGNLGSDLYTTVTFNALAELPSSLITLLLITKLNRRSSLIFFTIMSGILSISCVFLQDGGWRMAAEVGSFFGACTAFDLSMIYTLELFPTCVRNSALSLSRQAMVLGGVVAPVLVAEGRRRSFASFGVFGVVISGCGLFTATLPETRGRSMCDTMEEQEDKECLASS